MRRGNSNGVGCLDHSICPVEPVPATVLVAVMNDGSYLLVGYPHGGPSAYVTAEDAVPLRRVLDTAFGSEQPASTKAASPSRDLMRGTATQP